MNTRLRLLNRDGNHETSNTPESNRPEELIPANDGTESTVANPTSREELEAKM
jgi:hypothetical protein